MTKMPVIFEFYQLFSLGGRSKKGFSVTKGAKKVVPDGKDAVYIIKNGSNKTIYIGATWNKKTKNGEKFTASVVNRLEKHVDKFLNKNPVNAKTTKNWTRYRNKFNNHKKEIKKWEFVVFRGKKINHRTAHDFENALIGVHIKNHDNAPECNDEYSHGVKKSCLKKASSYL